MLLSQLPQTLSDRFGAPSSAMPDRQRRNAAVAVVLRPPAASATVGASSASPVGGSSSVGGSSASSVGSSPAQATVAASDVLLIRRAESKRDPWSGQMAFPGGRLDPADPSLVAAAVRETLEETGMALAPARDLIGRFPTVRPVSVHIPTVTIWPFVFRAAPGTKARAASAEVASAHWLSVASLTDPRAQGVHHWQGPGEQASFPCIRVDGRVVWGLTYRILMRLFQLGSTETASIIA